MPENPQSIPLQRQVRRPRPLPRLLLHQIVKRDTQNTWPTFSEVPAELLWNFDGLATTSHSRAAHGAATHAGEHFIPRRLVLQFAGINRLELRGHQPYRSLVARPPVAVERQRNGAKGR